MAYRPFIMDQAQNNRTFPMLLYQVQNPLELLQKLSFSSGLVRCGKCEMVLDF